MKDAAALKDTTASPQDRDNARSQSESAQGKSVPDKSLPGSSVAPRASSRSRKKAKGDDAERSVEGGDRAAETFKRGLLIRGEAVVPAGDRAFPSGATHEIVEKSGTVGDADKEGDEKELPAVKRRRYSMY